VEVRAALAALLFLVFGKVLAVVWIEGCYCYMKKRTLNRRTELSKARRISVVLAR
jgi:hypothetical protein